jgi:hypothetical protein
MSGIPVNQIPILFPLQGLMVIQAFLARLLANILDHLSTNITVGELSALNYFTLVKMFPPLDRLT